MTRVIFLLAAILLGFVQVARAGCAGLPSPPNGASDCEGKTLNDGDICTITCEYGIEVGVATRMCYNGEFSGEVVVCVTAPDSNTTTNTTSDSNTTTNTTTSTTGCTGLTSPPNGSSDCEGKTLSDGESCTITCDYGLASGTAARVCANGLFDGEEVICNEGSNTTTNATSNVTCDGGDCAAGTYFDASTCNATFDGCQPCAATICEDGEFWTATLCAGNNTGCKACAAEECLEGTTYDETMCGNETNGCVAANTTTNTTTVCHGLASPEFGTSNCENETVAEGESCTITCEFGLESGVEVRVCMNGSFDGEVAVCKETQSNNGTSSNMTCDASACTNGTVFDETMCNETHNGCVANNSTNSSTNTTNTTGCAGLASPEFGSSDCENETAAEGESCTITCEYGLESGAAVRVCLYGRFGGEAAVCKNTEQGNNGTSSNMTCDASACTNGTVFDETMCSATHNGCVEQNTTNTTYGCEFMAPEYGSSNCENGTVEEGESCTITCQYGIQSGNDTLMCVNGSWDSEIAVCNPTESNNSTSSSSSGSNTTNTTGCEGLMSPVDGYSDCENKTVAEGDSCNVRCKYGLESGDQKRVCTYGSFDGEIAVCSPADNNSTTSNNNTSSNNSTSNNSTCDASQCEEGMWFDDSACSATSDGCKECTQIPYCKKVTCTSGTKSQCSECMPGYKANGPDSCQKGGNNQGNHGNNGPQPGDCPALPNPTYGQSFCQKGTKNGQQCRQSCFYSYPTAPQPSDNETDSNSTNNSSMVPVSTQYRDCVNGSYTGMDITCESPCANNYCKDNQICMFDRQEERGCRCEDVVPTRGVCTVIVVIIVLPPGQSYGDVQYNVNRGLRRGGMKNYGVSVGPRPSGNDNHVPVSILCFPDATGSTNSSEYGASQALNIINSQSQSLHYNTAGDAEVTTQRAVNPSDCKDELGWSDNSTSTNSCSDDASESMEEFLRWGLYVVIAIIVIFLLCVLSCLCGVCGCIKGLIPCC